jgi:hypothetical protein
MNVSSTIITSSKKVQYDLSKSFRHSSILRLFNDDVSAAELRSEMKREIIMNENITSRKFRSGWKNLVDMSPTERQFYTS